MKQQHKLHTTASLVTAYDRQTHALIKNMDRASRAFNAADLQKNADGSVDLCIGPRPPAGKESNWIPTDPAREFELMVRPYGPTKAFFDKQWKLPEVEPTQSESLQPTGKPKGKPEEAENR